MQLYRHVQRFDRCVDRVNDSISHGLAQILTHPEAFESCVNGAIIRLHDVWAFTCREIIISSARGNCLARAQQLLPRSPQLSRGMAPVDFLRTKWTTRRTMPNRWEPHWFIPNDAIRAATILGVANEIQVTAGLGAVNFADHLRITRNVLAHSLPATWKAFRTLQLDLRMPVSDSPAEFFVSPSQNGSSRIMHDWTADLRLALMATIQ